MEISGQSLTTLFTGWNLIFQRAFEKAPSYFADLATITRSTSKRQEYPWLKRTVRMREWIGERVLQGLEGVDFSVLNRKFEATEEISRDDLEDDIQGIYEPMIEMLGEQTKVHPDLMIFGMIRNGLLNIDNPAGAPFDMAGISIPVPVCWDGVTLFSADGHPVGKAGDQVDVSNIDSGGGSAPYWMIVDASRAMRPFLYQLRKPFEAVHMNAPTDEFVFSHASYRYGVDGRDAAAPGMWQFVYASNKDLSNPANYGAARAAMREIKNDNGLPFGVLNQRSGIYLVVPPALEEVARQLLTAEFMAGSGASANVSTTNIWRNSADLIVSEYLSL